MSNWNTLFSGFQMAPSSVYRYQGAMDESRGEKGSGMPNTGNDTAMTAAGHPALAFVNTVADSGKSRDQDTFQTGEALIALLREGGLNPECDPPGTGQLGELISLREAAYGVLSAIAAGRKPFQEDSLFLENAIKSTMGDASFAPGPDGPLFRPGPMGGLYDTMVLSIMDLLQSGDLPRLRECRACTHLFIDRGRGPGRRWCSMSRCGNRAKARSFRDRRRVER